MATTTEIVYHSLLASPHLKLLLSFIVGFIGSAAYITALYFKFIGDTEINRAIVMKPFLKKYIDKNGIRCSTMNKFKCAWYCGIGGAIATIFQVDVPNFVSVQSLILGATWPAIVSQFLSGRMANPLKNELDEISDGGKVVTQEEIKKLNDMINKIGEDVEK